MPSLAQGHLKVWHQLNLSLDLQSISCPLWALDRVSMRESRGGGGQGVLPSLENQKLYGSIGNKQLDHPPPPLEKVGPPENVGTLWTLEKL